MDVIIHTIKSSILLNLECIIYLFVSICLLSGMFFCVMHKRCVHMTLLRIGQDQVILNLACDAAHEQLMMAITSVVHL